MAFAAVGWGYANADTLLTLKPALFFRSVQEIAEKLGCRPNEEDERSTLHRFL
jgi:hypothetical protein